MCVDRSSPFKRAASELPVLDRDRLQSFVLREVLSQNQNRLLKQLVVDFIVLNEEVIGELRVNLRRSELELAAKIA